MKIKLASRSTKSLGFSPLRAAQQKHPFAHCLFLCALLIGAHANADEPRIITFDAPGAGTAVGLGTQGIQLGSDGVILGFYSDANNVDHGFLRHRDGTFTTFDAPGAGTTAQQGTLSYSINPAGAVTGFFFDANFFFHGFLRTRDGTITVIDAPNAVYTVADNINPAGTIAGQFVDVRDMGVDVTE